MTSLVTPAMQAIIGRTIYSRTSYPIAQSDIRKWALATYYPDSPPAEFITDPQVAPEEFNPFAWATPTKAVRFSDHGPNVLEELAGIEGPNVRFQLNGGMGCDYGVPMRVGDVITSNYSIAGYSEKDGKLGRMLFTERQDTWTNQNGEVVRTNYMTLIRY